MILEAGILITSHSVLPSVASFCLCISKITSHSWLPSYSFWCFSVSSPILLFLLDGNFLSHYMLRSSSRKGTLMIKPHRTFSSSLFLSGSLTGHGIINWGFFYLYTSYIISLCFSLHCCCWIDCAWTTHYFLVDSVPLLASCLKYFLLTFVFYGFNMV